VILTANFSVYLKWHTSFFTADCPVYLMWTDWFLHLKWGSWWVWPVNKGCLLLLGTWSHLWSILWSVFAPFSDLYFLHDLWRWWLFVIYAILTNQSLWCIHVCDFNLQILRTGCCINCWGASIKITYDIFYINYFSVTCYISFSLKITEHCWLIMKFSFFFLQNNRKNQWRQLSVQKKVAERAMSHSKRVS
jgi:hypothetical protein